jgi:hypothetical protein
MGLQILIPLIMLHMKKAQWPTRMLFPSKHISEKRYFETKLSSEVTGQQACHRGHRQSRIKQKPHTPNYEFLVKKPSNHVHYEESRFGGVGCSFGRVVVDEDGGCGVPKIANIIIGVGAGGTYKVL